MHDDTSPIPPYEFSPWDFWRDADDAARHTQIAHIEALAAQHPDHRFGDLVFVARHASVDNDVLHLGDRTYVAAGAYLTGSLRAGTDCSINPYAVVRGDVTLGDGVRVGAHTSILGFNHSMEPGTPVHQQPLTSKGIVIGDDVWIGSHVVVLDGVRVGDHAVLAAGAVVTKDVPAGAIVAGNPARFLRWRVEPDATSDALVPTPSDAASSLTPADDPPVSFATDAESPSAPGLREVVTPLSPSVTVTTSATASAPGTASAATPAPGVGTADAVAPALATGSPSPSRLAGRVAAFAARARVEASAVLDRAWSDELGMFRDRPGAPVTVRAQADAIEIADLLLGTPPPQRTRDAHIALLHGWQDAATGAVAPLEDAPADSDGAPAAPAAPADSDGAPAADANDATIDGPDSAPGAVPPLEAPGRQRRIGGFDDPDAAYHVLSVGYALDLLGSAFPSPITWVTDATAGDVAAWLDALPWRDDAWGAGHHVDGFGTALLWTTRAGHPVPPGVRETLFGWLLTHADAATGMWGSPTPREGLLQPVNGFYRASRGTFAQFDVPLPHPQRVIDTVLRHSEDPRFFAPHARNACNVLDVAHPLWLTRATGHRSAEVRALAAQLLDHALTLWVPGEGMSFRAPSPTTHGLADTEPGLQGTEMWLAIIWYLADLVGVSDALDYRPHGVHRPEPAPS